MANYNIIRATTVIGSLRVAAAAAETAIETVPDTINLDKIQAVDVGDANAAFLLVGHV